MPAHLKCIISIENICSCAKYEQLRGHPINCNRFVDCVEDTDGTMYSFGKACQSGQCRNSLNKTCSDDCFDGVCSLEVPKGSICIFIKMVYYYILSNTLS